LLQQCRELDDRRRCAPRFALVNPERLADDEGGRRRIEVTMSPSATSSGYAMLLSAALAVGLTATPALGESLVGKAELMMLRWSPRTTR